jgi:hypothetical protein
MHLDVEAAGEMQRLEVLHPGIGDMIIRPVPLHRHGDLVVAGALEVPVIHMSNLLDHIDGMCGAVVVQLNQAHCHSYSVFPPRRAALSKPLQTRDTVTMKANECCNGLTRLR